MPRRKGRSNTHAKGKFVGGFFLRCDDGPETDDERDDVVKLIVRLARARVDQVASRRHSGTGGGAAPQGKGREEGQQTM